MWTAFRNLVYRADSGERGRGDVFLPAAGSAGASSAGPAGDPVLLIHGGGWNALAKESLEPLAHLFASEGRAVFNINYCLLQHAPWPACFDDCTAAGEFVLAGGLAGHGVPAPQRLLVCGASAGGHLAMMTGLRLPADRVEAIVSLAGPSLMAFPDGSSATHFESAGFASEFFGRTGAVPAEEIDAISPAKIVAKIGEPGAAPLYCIHSRHDLLVRPSHSEAAAAAWRRAGSEAEIFYFDGPGDSHGFWDSECRQTRQLIPDVKDAVRAVLSRLAVVRT